MVAKYAAAKFSIGYLPDNPVFVSKLQHLAKFLAPPDIHTQFSENCPCLVPKTEQSIVWNILMMSLGAIRPYFIPVSTALIGSGGFIIGIYSFISPVAAARVYGVDLPSLATITTRNRKKDISAASASTGDVSKHLSYIHAHGIRNFVTGLSILSMTAYWQFSDQCRVDPAASKTAHTCLGIVLLTGTLTPIVDAVVTWRSAEVGDVTEIGRKAARAHASRSLIWLLGGILCLLGS